MATSCVSLLPTLSSTLRQVCCAQISAVVAIGVAEGISHVNWQKVRVITAWWTGSLAPICLFTAALVAQGKLVPLKYKFTLAIVLKLHMQPCCL